MKRLAIYVVIAVLGLISCKLSAQTSVVGHIYAEVVESVGASAQSQQSFSVQKNNADGITFGKIEIKSAESSSCSLIMGKASLTGNNNDFLTMETSSTSTQKMEGNAINGYQFISLQCKPNEQILDQSSTQYNGNINVVLAYN